MFMISAETSARPRIFPRYLILHYSSPMWSEALVNFTNPDMERMPPNANTVKQTLQSSWTLNSHINAMNLILISPQKFRTIPWKRALSFGATSSGGRGGLTNQRSLPVTLCGLRGRGRWRASAVHSSLLLAWFALWRFRFDWPRNDLPLHRAALINLPPHRHPNSTPCFFFFKKIYIYVSAHICSCAAD